MSPNHSQIIQEHFVRYPNMETRDYIKLAYQGAFGPKHFSSIPAREEILENIRKEMETLEESSISPLVEELGGPFVRVSLFAVRQGKISVEEMADAFLHSFSESPSLDKKSMKDFNDRINEFLRLTVTRQILRPDAEIETELDDLFRKGIRPLHHSDAFRQLYRPHYRVIHEKYIPTLR